jgi:hypothetical protein
MGRARLSAVGVTDPDDLDLFTALVSGLGHQQIANDPGGDRWVRQSRRATEMFLAAVATRPPAGRRRPTHPKEHP